MIRSKAEITAIRQTLLRNGYSPLPNVDKQCRAKGWNTPEFVARELRDTRKGTALERIAKWEAIYPDCTATGILLADQLGGVDADIDDKVVIEAWFDAMARIAPDVHDLAPRRFGGGEFKQLLLVRVVPSDTYPEPFVRIASRKFVDSQGKKHQVEIFGGAMTNKGSYSRQVGAYGPHSHDESGAVLKFYRWDGDDDDSLATPLTLPRSELPTLTKEQAYALVLAFEELARAAGWTEVAPPNEGSTAVFLYDISEETRFAVQHGPDATDYAGLCDLFEARGELRCSSSFIPGDPGDNREKCQVDHCKVYDCIGIYDHETLNWHLPVEKKPKLDEAAFAEQLKQIAKDAGAVLAPPIPNWRERYRSGLPKPSFDNAVMAIAAAGFHCAEDLFHRKLLLEWTRPDAPSEGINFLGSITDTGILCLRKWLIELYGFDLTKLHLFDAVVWLARENAFDPVLDLLDDAQAAWDGVPRLDRMAVEYFNAADTEVNRACVRKMMIGAVLRARVPGAKFDTILVLEGPEGFNKSTAWRILAGDANFSDERVIGAASREVQEALAGIWIHENADLAGLAKREVETVKAYASRMVDRARPAYGHFLVEQPRRSIDVGTTNNKKYLQSQTGNRRFWPIEVLREIDLELLRRDRLQLWGEAAHYQAQGESAVLERRLWPAVGIEQEKRRVEDAWELDLADLQRVPISGPMKRSDASGMMCIWVVGNEERVHSHDVFQALGITSPHLKRGFEGKRVTDAMRGLGWGDPEQVKINGINKQGYRRKITDENEPR